MNGTRADLDTARLVRSVLVGKLLSQSLSTFVELGVADALSRGAMCGEELAGALDADPRVLTQLLRALVPFDVVSHDPITNRFALGNVGLALTRDAEGSAYASALLAGGVMGGAWSRLSDSVRTGTPAFDLAHGVDLFTALDGDPDLRRLFHESQARDLDLSVSGLTEAIDVPESATILDVGGGEGAFLEALMKATGAGGILMDTPSTIAGVPAARAASMTLAPGDFFDSVPSGADVIVLRDILHDWADEQAVRILQTCGRAVAEKGRIVVVERTLNDATDAEGLPSPHELAPLMNLYMVTVLGGCERSIDDFRVLAATAGLAEQALSVLPDGTMVLELGLHRDDRGEPGAVLRDLADDVRALREVLRGLSVDDLREVSDHALLLHRESESLLG